MGFITFKDWLAAKESTAFTRTRAAAAKGLGPDIPDASINAHDTAPPWQQEAFAKKRKKHKKSEKKKS